MTDVWGCPSVGSGLGGIAKPEPWTEEATCAQVDPELFFLEKGQTAKASTAKKICAVCPVISQCAEWAYRTGDRHAILGGLTSFDRRTARQEARRNNGKAA